MPSWAVERSTALLGYAKGTVTMKTLSFDIETYSDQPLAKTGVYRYVESPVFEILLFAYSVDGGSVQQVDLACGEQIPTDIAV